MKPGFNFSRTESLEKLKALSRKAPGTTPTRPPKEGARLRERTQARRLRPLPAGAGRQVPFYAIVEEFLPRAKASLPNRPSSDPANSSQIPNWPQINPQFTPDPKIYPQIPN